MATLARELGERTTLQLSAGAVLDGRLRGEGRSYDVGPGPLLSVTGAERVLGGRDQIPFLTLTLALGASFPRTHDTSSGERSHFSAFDLRAGVLFGATLFERLSPYVAARAFGGPVAFSTRGAARTGTDVHHYAVGPGVSLVLGKRWSLGAEAIFLGEQSFGGGASFAF